MNIMLDLNVVLDFVQHRIPHYDASASVVSKVVARELSGCIPSHSVTTIYYIIEKYSSTEKANEVVDWLLQHFEIVQANKTTFLQARNISLKDFEDAVVVISAETEHCDYIITRNVADFKGSPISAVTPEEFLIISVIQSL